MGADPQQPQIIYLAACGQTNREIADQLFQSLHTVASHLYRSYPGGPQGPSRSLLASRIRGPWPGSQIPCRSLRL